MPQSPAQGPEGVPARSENWPIARPGFFFLLPVVCLALVAALIGWFLIAVGLGLAAGFLAWFFRNPSRQTPDGPGLIIAPADGRVVEAGTPVGEAGGEVRVSIFMSVFDPHVNRAPVAGRVLEIRHRPGRYLPAYRAQATRENEQNAILFEQADGRRVRCIQVAGLLARRILCWVREGDQVSRGRRFGMICFGSRVDTYLPPGIELQVRLGDRVKAGESVLGILR